MTTNRLPPFLQSTLLVLGSVIFCLFLMEGMVRAFVSVRNVGPSFTTYDPIYGKRLKRGFDTDRITPEFEMHFSTNSLGFRGPEFSTKPHRSILFIGDSFTMGYGVSDGQEFPFLVGEHIADSEGDGLIPVVNVGMGDNGNGRPLKFLRDEAAELEPRLIVLQFAENDFNDNLREQLFKLDEADDELIEFNTAPAGKLQKVQAWIESVPGLQYSYLVGFARQIVVGFMRLARPPRDALTSAESRRRDRLTLRLVHELLSLTKENGWPVVILAVGISDRRLSELKGLCDRHEVDLIAVPSKRERPDLYYAVDAHWNPAGHAYVAELVITWFREYRQVWQGSSGSASMSITTSAR